MNRKVYLLLCLCFCNCSKYSDAPRVVSTMYNNYYMYDTDKVKYMHDTLKIDTSTIFYEYPLWESSKNAIYESDTLFMYRKKVNNIIYKSDNITIGPLYGYRYINPVYLDVSKYNYLSIIAYFKNDLVLSNSIFNNFKFHSICHGEVNLSRATFKNKADFRDSKFYKGLDFSFTIFDSFSTQNFSYTRLPDTINFDSAKILNNGIDFEGADFTFPERNYFEFLGIYWNLFGYYYKKHVINLYHTDISKFHIDYTHFQLYIPNYRMDDLPPDFFGEKNMWFKINTKISKEEILSMYQSLLKNFKDHGQEESYQLLDIEYHDFTFGNLKFIKWWNCYGYHKEWILIWSAIFIIIFTLFTYRKIELLTSQVYTFKYVPQLLSLSEIKSIANIYPKKSRDVKLIIRQRKWYSIIYTLSVFFMLTLKLNKLKLENKRLALYIILMYVVGLICLGYIANFIIQK